MTAAAFPSQAHIVRAIKAAEKAGLPVFSIRVMPDGSVVIFAQEAPMLANGAPLGDNEPNDFD